MEAVNANNLQCCHCNEVAVLTTAWTPKNPGRRFFGCRFYGKPGACRFFRWYDEEIPERSKEVINGLLRRLNKLEREKEAMESKKNPGTVVGKLL
ncbi:hypothetical protein LUZ63_018398 [Rhynchospora breviuscula]|uniref:GRF-type domain-containing protein n=2 Tax=Rhynchospora breviuscula TaxID=2022672 RepID=A0A9Q0C4A4_9POAL|nr:hypothetical protein LUZ63_018398 [Rhynchospora breviuscula]